MNSPETLQIAEYIARVRELRPLQRKSEQDAATALVRTLGLPSHHDPQKNWDTFKCLAHVLLQNDRENPVFDAGSGLKSVILRWLSQLGYGSLYACDLKEADAKALKQHGINFSVQDISRTNYPDSFFQAVTSISVIEHNVPLAAFAADMMRVLKPGGLLAVSTDYWPDYIDCSGIYPYGVEAGQMKVFNRDTLREFVDICEGVGFVPCGPIEYEAAERTVRWERVDRDYTFAFLAFRKPGRSIKFDR